MPAVTLVNANEMRPPIGPLALDYLAAAMETFECEVRLLDLTWESDPAAALAAHFRDFQPTLVGFTLRNTDDCYLAGHYSCLPHARRILALLRQATDAPLVVGGCAYSLFPAALFETLGVDYGLASEGELALPLLVQALARREDPSTIPGLVHRSSHGTVVNPPQFADLSRLPLFRREWLDNRRYWLEGGQGGFETKRGCNRACIYCADPVAKGRVVRLRDPRQVALELDSLVAQGVTHLHTCDAEFNLPREHALAVCDAILDRGLADRLAWWAYCAPGSFDDELAERMRRAGCVGIDFGADHGDDAQLARLGRDHRVADLERTAKACHQHGLIFMFDLLLGAPGDTREGIAKTIELMRRLEPSRVGISAGVRLYPGTALASRLASPLLPPHPGLLGELDGNDNLLYPVFYLEPALGPDFSAYLSELTASDSRFLVPDPESGLADYNYRENLPLQAAISAGYRGAYWDILRRRVENLPPA
ncbi:MAG: radical SAM protein [candidate division WS1 bacterium]|nr:radical SAM protein [candidate division WS1 bacterium]